MIATPQPIPAELEPFAAELAALHRELPRLLRDKQAGRCALMRNGAVDSLWDTARDATEHGRRTFGDGRFVAIRLDPRFVGVLTRYFGESVGESA